MALHPILPAFLSAALFGAATPASKGLLADLSPFQLAGLLYLSALSRAHTISFSATDAAEAACGISPSRVSTLYSLPRQSDTGRHRCRTLCSCRGQHSLRQ
jgi:hypothetical protein